MKYSVDGLLKVFPKYFKTREFAEAYVNKKDRDVYIANRNSLFRELGLEIIVTGNESKFMQSKAILEREG